MGYTTRNSLGIEYNLTSLQNNDEAVRNRQDHDHYDENAE